MKTFLGFILGAFIVGVIACSSYVIFQKNIYLGISFVICVIIMTRFMDTDSRGVIEEEE